MDWSRITKIHFIGIKGVGMTMLAEYLHGQGKLISGSDVADVFMTDQVLHKIKAQVLVGFRAEQIPRDSDLIIYSSAYNETNPELASALAGAIKTISYADALAEVFNQSYGIAVCGSHGKTTTSAWLGYVLNAGGLEPSVMVGATVPQWGSASLIGKSNYLVIEADEYQNKFLKLTPKIIVLNNIDYDHPDFFPDRSSYLSSFRSFIKSLPKSGTLIANFDDPLIRQLAPDCSGTLVSYSRTPGQTADFIADNITAHQGRQYFRLSLNNDDLGNFNIALSGEHNISNALAVIASSLELGLPLTSLRQQLAEFQGTARRFQYLGQYHGATIIDDYAHHPTEIKASLAACKQKFPGRRIIAVFHPHTYSRTQALLQDFAQSFELAEILLILEIYASAREQAIALSSQSLVQVMQEQKTRQHIEYVADLSSAQERLAALARPNDVILLLGAGDVFRLGEALIKANNNL